MRLNRYTHRLALVLGTSIALGCSGASLEDSALEGNDPAGHPEEAAELDENSASDEPDVEDVRVAQNQPDTPSRDAPVVEELPAGDDDTLKTENTPRVAPSENAADPQIKGVSGSALVSGSITDAGTPLTEHGLGGRGLLVGADSVRLSNLVDGMLEVAAEVSVDAAGQFSAELPLGLDIVVAEVLDVDGNVLGAVLVGATGKTDGAVVVAAPVNLETSVEVEVLLRAARCGRCDESSQQGTNGWSSRSRGASHPGCSPSAGLLMLDVLAMIDADLATAIASAVAAGADVDLLVDSLANAVALSARARAKTLIDAGLDLDVDALVAAQLEALAKLNAQLNAVLQGQASPLDVTAALLAELQASLDAAASADISADLSVRAQVAADLAFSAALSASLTTAAHADVVLFAALRVAARLEATIAAQAVVDLVVMAGGSQGAVAAARTAGQQLVADVAAAVDLQGITQARLDFVAALSGGGGHSSGGLLTDVLVGVTGLATGTVGSVLDVVADLKADLDAQLKAQLAAMVDLNLCVQVDAAVDAEVNLSALVRALADFAADVQALAPSLQNGTTGQVTTDALARLLATTELLLRVDL